jgi:hypothetical protein
MEEAYTLMRDETTHRVDLRVRSETMLELHSGLVQLWLYCLARETGSPPSTLSLTIDVTTVTEATIARLTEMFRKAGVAFFLRADSEPETTHPSCTLGAFRTSLMHYTISFSLLAIPKTLCSGRLACT